MSDPTIRRDAIGILVLLYLGSFALFTLVGWFTGRAIDRQTMANILLGNDVKRMREAVEGLNLKLGRYEQELERRSHDFSEAIRAVLPPNAQFKLDVTTRLQRLERKLSENQ